MSEHNCDFTCTCKKSGKKLLDAVQKPTVRQSMHYECGVYKSDTALSPIMSIHLGGDHAAPLIKVAAVILAALAAVILFFRLRKE